MTPTSFRDTLGRYATISPLGRHLLRKYAFYRSRLHVVSYPKCGRTWLRYALGVILCEHFGITIANDAELLEINRLSRIDARVPSIRFSHDDNPHLKRLDQLGRNKHAYRSRDVILLVRDPRDVVVSSFHQHTRRAPVFGDPGFEGSLDEFIRHPVFGIRVIVEFLNIWASARDIPRSFLLLRYEDMQETLERELRRVLSFIGIHVENRLVKAGAVAASFERMQELEHSDALGAGRLRPSDPSDPNSFKVRRGEVGGFRDELSASDVEYVDTEMARLDPFFGYEG